MPFTHGLHTSWPKWERRSEEGEGHGRGQSVRQDRAEGERGTESSSLACSPGDTGRSCAHICAGCSLWRDSTGNCCKSGPERFCESGIGNQFLNGVACGSATFCVAVGADSGEGVVVPISGGTPGSAELVSGTVLLSAVTCPTATICIAVGNGQYSEYGNTWWDGVVVEITNGVPGQAVVAPLGEGMPDAPDEMYLNGVGCSSASACVAVGYDDYEHGVVVPIRDGSPGMEKEVPGGDNGAYDLNGVACYKKACLAVGPSMEETRYPDATVVPITNGKPVSSNLAVENTRSGCSLLSQRRFVCVSRLRVERGAHRGHQECQSPIPKGGARIKRAQWCLLSHHDCRLSFCWGQHVGRGGGAGDHERVFWQGRRGDRVTRSQWRDLPQQHLVPRRWTQRF